MILEFLSNENSQEANYRIVGKTPGFRSLIRRLEKIDGFEIVKTSHSFLSGDFSVMGSYQGLPVLIETPLSDIIISCDDRSECGSSFLKIMSAWEPSLFERLF